jgi:hypothetical protein
VCRGERLTQRGDARRTAISHPLVPGALSPSLGAPTRIHTRRSHR